MTAVVLVTFGASQGSAAAPPDCEVVDKNSGVCVVTVEAPGASPVRPVNDSAPDSNGGGPACFGYDDQPVPCSDPYFGTWSNAMQCYLKLADPQPAATDASWEGNDPRGAVYYCGDPARTANYPVWLPQGPEAPMSPEQAAQIVVRRMDLRAADIGIVPEDEPGSIGAVGAPVYMWTARGPATFGPQVLTGSAGGVTITATAKVDRIVWAMGDGTSVTCRTPGTVYEDRYGFNMSPDCGHRYSRTSAGKAGNAYPVTATSYWLVDWTGPAGSSGQIPLTLSSDTSIQVGELQALVTR